MGIRFYCPNGHKLNVKTFLAGRRGICPHCGAKVQIPTESTLPASTIDTARDKDGPASPPPSLSVPSEGEQDEMGIGEPTSGRSSAAAGRKSARKDTAGVPAEEPSAAGPDLGLPEVPVPSAGGPVPLAGGGGAPSRGPEKPTPRSDSLVDPLGEAPDAAWYVRTPGSGQFGPANGQAMRQWIEEGRISGDSLVWREGWRDWREASAVFAQMGSSRPIPKIDTGGSPLASRRSGAASSQSENGAPPRRESSGKPTLIVTVLTLAVVVLSVVLAWVLLR